MDKDRAQKFLWRVVEDVGTGLRGALCYIGDKLGIFKAMAGAGPLTAEELALKTGLSERYIREWLGAMATAEYVEYDSATSKYLLPEEHAGPLGNEESPVFVGGFFQMLVPLVSVAPQVADAFRTGTGVSQSAYPPEFFAALERGTAPKFKHKLLKEWLPALPEVRARLESGGSALDVGCGSGMASITLARAFPQARIFGYDNHPGSIERARANAQAAGVADRVSFEVVDGTHLPAGQFDFISTFDVVHDAVDPPGLLTAIRKALAEGGTYLMLEMNASAKVEENMTPRGRMLYAISTLYCMTTSLAEGGPGIGALMGEPKARELAQAAGFTHFRRVAEDPFNVIYELKA